MRRISGNMERRILRSTLLFVMVVLAMCGDSLATGGDPTYVIHVKSDAGGAANGTSWEDAYTTVKAGVTNVGGDKTNIWITGGTYSEGSVVTVSTAVVIVGGFAGTESAVSGRTLTNTLGVVTNYTAINGENSHSCFRITASDAVSLEAMAFTNALYSWANGGGLWKSGSGTLVLNNCRIAANRSGSYNSDGVGGCFTAGTVLMTNCVVADNRLGSYSARGGGIYSYGANLTMVDCVVSNNGGAAAQAYRTRGTGLWFDNGTLAVSDTLFVTNVAGGSGSGGGGGAVCLGSSATMSATFTRCVFRANQLLNDPGNAGGAYGGVVWANLNASRTSSFVNCDFAFNENATTDGRGGAIYQSAGTVILKNCILWTNRCTGLNSAGHELSVGGGTMNVSYSDLSGLVTPYIDGTANFSNCMAVDPRFASSTDLHLKSAAGRWDPGTGTFVNDSVTSPCIDAGDPADSIGAEPTDNGNSRINPGVYGGTAQASKTQPVPAPQLADRGSVVHYDRARISGELTNAASVLASVTLYYGLGDGGMATGSWDKAISFGLQSDGSVLSQWTPALQPSTTYTYRWFATNSAGSVWTDANTFLTGAASPGGGTNVIHVNPAATGGGDGVSWPHAFTTLRAGVMAIGGVRTNVWITGGSYREGLHFSLGQSAKLVGGFAGTESSIAERAFTNALGVVTNYTAIDGSNAYSCLKITAGDVEIETVAFTNAVFSWANGGAIWKSGAGTLVLNNCRITDNRWYSYGGYGIGCYFTAGTVLMTNCVVSGNRFGTYDNIGAGICSDGANLTMVDCVVSSNGGSGVVSFRAKGAGLYFNNGNLNVLRTDFLSNTGGVNRYKMGAGISLGNSVTMSALFSNCVFRGNRALEENGAVNGGGYGAAIGASLNSIGRTVTVVSCTFSDNRNETVNGAGGAIYLTNGTLVIRNSILWTNTVQDGLSGSEILAIGPDSRVEINYSDMTGTNYPHVIASNSAVVVLGAGIISADPLYASATDVHLRTRAGRWDPAVMEWVYDRDTSPCIDAGDPSDYVGSETMPNGNKINLGRYGGTAEASRTLLLGTVLILR